MPIYEYQCLSCGRRTEQLQRMDDPPLAACPHCGGEVKKLISSPAVQFKGSGWYVTDYAGKKSGGGAKSEGGSGGGESSSAAKESGGSGGESGGDKAAGSGGGKSGGSD